MSAERTPRAYFEHMYSATSDPWDFETSAYEHRKYHVLLDALPEQTYDVCFEPACSNGVLTAYLAQRCALVHAVDIVDTAAEAAAERMRRAGIENVVIRCADADGPWPAGLCDLLVLSEFLYYYPAAELPDVVARLLRLVHVGGTVAACHWTGRSDDHAASGADVRAALEAAPGLRRIDAVDDPDFLVDVFRVSPN